MDSRTANLREQWKEDEDYRKMVEKMIHDDPGDSALMYAKAFFRLGKAGFPGKKDVLLFPVKILKGRKSFGKLQCLITPLLTGADLPHSDHSLGQRWVDRKFLVLGHDHEFKLYQKFLDSEEG